MPIQSRKLVALNASLCAALTLCVSQSFTAAALEIDSGSVVISELMPNVQDSDIDWIEFYNPTQANIDLKGCVLSDDRSDKLLIEDSLIIESHGYTVIASGTENGTNIPESLKNLAMTFSQENFSLTTGPDQVVLTCNSVIIDKVTYTDYKPGPATESRGWQLDPKSLNSMDNDNASNWCYTNLPVLSEINLYGKDKVASPGRENPACSLKVLPYAYVNDQAAVLIPGIDLETTLKIAEEELTRNIATAELTIWAIRDQVITAEIAQKIATLYMNNIERLYHTKSVAMIDSNHAVWHFAWAIANLYRNGNDEVKAQLQIAYDDALTRPQTLPRFRLIATDNVLGERILMGDAHEMARSFVKKHVVVPGNPEFVQSYDEYVDKRRGNLEIFFINIAYNAKKFFDGVFD